MEKVYFLLNSSELGYSREEEGVGRSYLELHLAILAQVGLSSEEEEAHCLLYWILEEGVLATQVALKLKSYQGA